MQIFRENFAIKLITLVITVLCLNMSFFLTEVRMHDMRKDIGFIKIIALILSGTYSEEHRDLDADASGEDTSNETIKEIDLLFFTHCHSRSGYVLVCVLKKSSCDHSILLEGNYETFTPPPWC